MKRFLKILFILFVILAALAAGGYSYLYFAFPKVSAATDLKIESTPLRIERGRYLANGFAFCIDCHSERDFAKFSGPVVPGTEGKGGFDLGEGAGFVPASNITQDKETGIGSWTDGEIFRAITSGVNKEGKFLAPMMPYTEFSKMDKEDIYSIISYIKTLPAIKFKVPERDLKFPLSLIFRTIPKDAVNFGSKPDISDRIATGKYYSIACNVCHSPNVKGEFPADRLFSGGMEFPMPDGTIITSANISPDVETGIGNLGKELFISKFKACSDPANLDVRIWGYNTPMAWNFIAKTVRAEDLEAVYDYLMTQKPVNHKVEKITLQGVK